MQSFSGNQRPDLLTSLMNFAHFWQGAQSLATATQNDVWTSKSAPNPSVFYTFDFEMCFASQRRALFRHRNFQKRSGAEVFCAFWLRSVLRAQRRALFRHRNYRNFQKWQHGVFCALWIRNVLRATNGVHFFDISTSKSGPDLGVLYILTSKCASRRNGVHFFDITASKSAPKLRCFVHFDLETCFAPQRHAIFHLSSGQLAPHPPL